MIDLQDGFQIYSPAILVPWGLTEPKLIDLFKATPLHRVAKWHYVINCEPLEGLRCGVAIQIDGEYGVCELQLFSSSNPVCENPIGISKTISRKLSAGRRKRKK